MAEPVIVTIFGATGDLAEKKLFPALFELFRQNQFPSAGFAIVGVARRPFSHEEFRTLVRSWCRPHVAGSHPHVHEYEADMDTFLEKIYYHQGFFDDVSTYTRLAPFLAERDEEFGVCSHKLFHLALSPFFYETVLDSLYTSGLYLSCVDGPGKTKILLEKPIGMDQKSARKINRLLTRIFFEDHIFRIDHYLMKSALWDMLTLHLNDPSLYEVWDKRFVHSIDVHQFETLDIQGRGGFYDHIGALRDVGQNHLLQMVALLLMDKPSRNDVAAFRKERAKVLGSLSLPKFSRLSPLVIRGQYEGYDHEEGVEAGSQTETYFSFEALSTLPRWKGVPITFSGGKALDRSVVEAIVRFKNGDTIVFQIQPNPHMVFSIGKKKEAMSWDELHHVAHHNPEGYERVYIDALYNHQTRFIEKHEVDASWKFIDAVRKMWQTLPLQKYMKGDEPLHFIKKIK